MSLGVYQKTEEHKKKLREILKPTQFLKGHIPWNKGITWKRGKNHKPFSQEWREKQSNIHKGKPAWNKGICGSQSHAWQGGKSDLTARIRISAQYKKWRADVFRRDGWTCQTCGLRGHGKDIEAHHVIPMNEILRKIEIKGLNIDDLYILAMSLTELFYVDNGITLCKDCHILTYTKEERNV